MHHQWDTLGLWRRGQHHLLGACLQMFFQVLPLAKDTAALENQFHPQVLPRKLGRVFLGKHGIAVAVDHQMVVFGPHLVAVPAIHCVVADQVGQIIRRHKVVGSDEFQLRRVAQDL